MDTLHRNTISKSDKPNRSAEAKPSHLPNHFIKNQRSHTRYFRQDIEVRLKARRLFEKKYALAKLIDITPQGACIVSHKVLRENNKLLIKLSFGDGEEFLFKARIVRRIKRKGLPYIYGAEFENKDALFKEHLLTTQLRLNLKKHSFSQAERQPA